MTVKENSFKKENSLQVCWKPSWDDKYESVAYSYPPSKALWGKETVPGLLQRLSGIASTKQIFKEIRKNKRDLISVKYNLCYNWSVKIRKILLYLNIWKTFFVLKMKYCVYILPIILPLLSLIHVLKTTPITAFIDLTFYPLLVNLYTVYVYCM